MLNNQILSYFILNPSRNLKIKIGNKRLNEEDCVKFLGVLVDSTLS